MAPGNADARSHLATGTRAMATRPNPGAPARVEAHTAAQSPATTSRRGICPGPTFQVQIQAQAQAQALEQLVTFDRLHPFQVQAQAEALEHLGTPGRLPPAQAQAQALEHLGTPDRLLPIQVQAQAQAPKRLGTPYRLPPIQVLRFRFWNTWERLTGSFGSGSGSGFDLDSRGNAQPAPSAFERHACDVQATASQLSFHRRSSSTAQPR